MHENQTTFIKNPSGLKLAAVIENPNGKDPFPYTCNTVIAQFIARSENSLDN